MTGPEKPRAPSRRLPLLLPTPLGHIPERPCEGRVDHGAGQVLRVGVVFRSLVHGEDREVLGHYLLRLPYEVGPLLLVEDSVGLREQTRDLFVLVAVVVLSRRVLVRRYLIGGEEHRLGGVRGGEPGPLGHLEVPLDRPLSEEGRGRGVLYVDRDAEVLELLLDQLLQRLPEAVVRGGGEVDRGGRPLRLGFLRQLPGLVRIVGVALPGRGVVGLLLRYQVALERVHLPLKELVHYLLAVDAIGDSLPNPEVGNLVQVERYVLPDDPGLVVHLRALYTLESLQEADVRRRVDKAHLAGLERRDERVGVRDEPVRELLDRGLLAPVILVEIDGQVLALLPLLELVRAAANDFVGQRLVPVLTLVDVLGDDRPVVGPQVPPGSVGLSEGHPDRPLVRRLERLYVLPPEPGGDVVVRVHDLLEGELGVGAGERLAVGPGQTLLEPVLDDLRVLLNQLGHAVGQERRVGQIRHDPDRELHDAGRGAASRERCPLYVHPVEDRGFLVVADGYGVAPTTAATTLLAATAVTATAARDP